MGDSRSLFYFWNMCCRTDIILYNSSIFCFTLFISDCSSSVYATDLLYKKDEIEENFVCIDFVDSFQ